MKIYSQTCIRTYLFVLIFIILIFTGLLSADAAKTLIISEGDEWHYFKGTEDPPKKWYSRDFDGSVWVKGPSGFGYGPGKHNTVLGDMKGKYKNVYVRRDFTVIDHSKITKMVLSIFCDGPFIAYLNGIKAIRSRKPQRGDPLNLTGFAHEMDPGRNVIAVQCSNDNINSDDYSFIPVFEFHEGDVKHGYDH